MRLVGAVDFAVDQEVGFTGGRDNRFCSRSRGRGCREKVVGLGKDGTTGGFAATRREERIRAVCNFFLTVLERLRA